MTTDKENKFLHTKYEFCPYCGCNYFVLFNLQDFYSFKISAGKVECLRCKHILILDNDIEKRGVSCPSSAKDVYNTSC